MTSILSTSSWCISGVFTMLEYDLGHIDGALVVGNHPCQKVDIRIARERHRHVFVHFGIGLLVGGV